MRIDTAVSFWKKDAPSPADEPLILHQDYLPQHLGFVLMEHGLTGVIAIQHAERNPSTRIGCLDGGVYRGDCCSRPGYQRLSAKRPRMG